MIKGLLHKFVREDDKLIYAPVVAITLSKYILYQEHDILEHNGIARAYQYLKCMYYWNGY